MLIFLYIIHYVAFTLPGTRIEISGCNYAEKLLASAFTNLNIEVGYASSKIFNHADHGNLPDVDIMRQ